MIDIQNSDKFILEDPDLAEEIPIELLKSAVVITDTEAKLNPTLAVEVKYIYI